MTRENFHVTIRAIARDHQPAAAPAGLTSSHLHVVLPPEGNRPLSNGSTDLLKLEWFNFKPF
jgi:hypothetical protein